MKDAQFFAFESDFVASLRCIPMAARLRLDLTGIKLKLNEWSKLDLAAREDVATLPCATPAERAAYCARLNDLVAKSSGTVPGMLADLPDPEWENASAVPTQVAAQAQASGRRISQTDWSGLSPLQRFALIKLSRPGHENRNFVPACDEFRLP